ncbi:MAG: hypothetical protein V1827_00095 [Candidatus Micrarchaeota archaeon]
MGGCILMRLNQLQKRGIEAEMPGRKAKAPEAKGKKPAEGHEEKTRFSRWGKFKDAMKAGLMVAASALALGVSAAGCGSSAKNGADTGVSQDASGLQDAATTDASVMDGGILDAAVQLDASVLPDAALDAAIQQDAAQPDAQVIPDAEVVFCNGAQIADVGQSYSPFVIDTVTAPAGNQGTFKCEYVLGSEFGAVEQYVVMNLYCPDGVTLLSGNILPGNAETTLQPGGGKQVRLRPRSWTAGVALVDVNVEDSP